jgi:integrase
MQQGSIIKAERKHGPAVWQFRWSETGSQGQRVYRKRVVGTIEDYPDSEAVREAYRSLIVKPSSGFLDVRPTTMTVGDLCQHFRQRELVQDDNWRSYSTRKNYSFLLKRWIVPRWGKFELGEVRTVEVESWLRSLARARSTCATIRNLMSVLFNHAWRYEFFDRNPIKLVRQSAKRRTAPCVLIPAEIKLLLDNLEIRERTLVLLAASTGLRQSELFALKWGDIDFSQGTMNVTRSIAYGHVGRCKTEASQKPVPVHPILAKALTQWRDHCRYAILLILARLGLRACEIKALTLGDLDWQEGLIKVRGKAGRYSQLPLPPDVGEAIADYLRNARPTSESRCVFLRSRAPAGTFRSECAIASVVKHALERAGIEAPRKGTHQFRHGLASQMLRQGATLSEIGELLRHRSPQTTAIYAKVDLISLATLALPWPGGAQ